MAEESNPTNESQSALETAKRYLDPTNIISKVESTVVAPVRNFLKSPIIGKRNPPNAKPTKETPGKVYVNRASNSRVRLRVPYFYLGGAGEGQSVSSLYETQGIIFPYTPQISYESRANYANINAIHSNYTQYFYKNTQIGEITLTAKFTVQNEKEAAIYLDVISLLRVLVKMKFGDDENAGSPPPVCRLDAYGEQMLDKVPVAITSFRFDLPENVDYFTTGKRDRRYGETSVPVVSTITLGLIPIYSRNEMLNASVSGWLNENQRSKGYL